MTRRFTLQEATDLAARAIRAAGGGDEAALSLARATVSADAHGKGSSGFSHLVDYLAAFKAGRIVGDAEPLISSPAPAAIHCDARGGIAQAGFDRAFDSLCERARTFGLALFAQNGSYTTGELGYYPRRLAEAGLVAFGGDKRAGADDGRRREGARLLHEPDRFCRAARPRAAAPDRPGVQRDRLCSAPTLRGARRAAAAGLGGRFRWRANHRSQGRASRRAFGVRGRARRQYRADGRGHGRRPCWRELGARRARVHVRRSLAGRRPSGHRDHAGAARARTFRSA